MNFGSVTPEITRLECVQQVLQQVSLTVFAKRQHCKAMRRSVFFCFATAVASGLHARLCRAFLVVLYCTLLLLIGPKIHRWSIVVVKHC